MKRYWFLVCFCKKNILKNLFRARYSIFSWFSRYKIYFLCTFAYLPSLFFLHYLLNIIYFCSKLFSSYYCSYVPIYYIVFFCKGCILSLLVLFFCAETARWLRGPIVCHFLCHWFGSENVWWVQENGSFHFAVPT